MISRYAQLLRIVVAGWIFVGFGGSLLVAFFGIMAVTGTGPFQDKAHFSVDSEFAPGQEVPTDTVHSAVLVGGIMVLAYPETVDPSTVECTTKSRVYSTGKQDIGEAVIEAPEGVTDVLASQEPTPRRFVPLAIVDWMDTAFISCTGEGAESFALTSSEDIHPPSFRYRAGAILLLLSPVLFGLGFLALHLARKWSRQASQAYAQLQYHHPVYPPLPPGHNPYGPPPGSHR